MKFLNGEIAACNVVPGSQKTLDHATIGAATSPVEINADLKPNYPPDVNPDSIDADAYDQGFRAAESDTPANNPYIAESQKSLSAAWDEGFRDAYSQIHGQRGN